MGQPLPYIGAASAAQAKSFADRYGTTIGKMAGTALSPLPTGRGSDASARTGPYNTSGDWGNMVSASTIAKDNAAYKLSPEAQAIGEAAMPANIQADANNTVDQWGQVNQADAAAVAGWEDNQIMAMNAIQNPESTVEKIMGPLALAVSVGALTAGVGAGVGAAVGGGFGGSLAGGAAAGATGAAATDTLTGKPLTLKSVGEGAALGAVGGGLTYGAGQYSGNIASSTGVPQGIVNAGLKAGIGATTSALGSSFSGNSSSGANTSGSMGGASIGGAALGGAATSGVTSNSLGNIANMADTSTDTSLASTITGALPGLLQAGVGAGTSLAASNAQVNADQNAITTQQNNLGNINNIWSTQQGLGKGADTALGSALGTNGQPANYSGFENMPGYSFAVSQGTQAIQRQAAAMGNAYTPNTAAAVGQYVTGTASQDYNTYISQLMGAAGLGSTANTGLQTGSQQSSNNISTLQQNIGQAQAAGISGVGSAAGGLFGANGAGTGLIGAASNYLGGGSNGGGSGGGYGGGGSGVNTSNPNNLGGSTDVAAPGQTLQYDANGNIIGSADTSAYAGSANYGQSYDPATAFNSSGDSAWNSVSDSGGSSFLGEDW